MVLCSMVVNHDGSIEKPAKKIEHAEEPDEESFQTLLKNAMGNASAHGLPNIDRSESIPRKLFWAVLFIAGLSMFLWQCLQLIDNFYGRNVDTSIELKYSKRLTFPAITICNLNPIKLSNLRNNDLLNELLGSATSTQSTYEAASTQNLPNEVNPAVNPTVNPVVNPAVNPANTVAALAPAADANAQQQTTKSPGIGVINQATVASNEDNYANNPVVDDNEDASQTQTTHPSGISDKANAPITDGNDSGSSVIESPSEQVTMSSVTTKGGVAVVGATQIQLQSSEMGGHGHHGDLPAKQSADVSTIGSETSSISGNIITNADESLTSLTLTETNNPNSQSLVDNSNQITKLHDSLEPHSTQITTPAAPSEELTTANVYVQSTTQHSTSTHHQLTTTTEGLVTSINIPPPVSEKTAEAISTTTVMKSADTELQTSPGANLGGTHLTTTQQGTTERSILSATTVMTAQSASTDGPNLQTSESVGFNGTQSTATQLIKTSTENPTAPRSSTLSTSTVLSSNEGTDQTILQTSLEESLGVRQSTASPNLNTTPENLVTSSGSTLSTSTAMKTHPPTTAGNKEATFQTPPEVTPGVGPGPGGKPVPGKRRRRASENIPTTAKQAEVVQRVVEPPPQKRFGDWDNVDFERKNEKHALKQEVLDAIATINYEDRKPFGHDIEDMLLSCTWAGYSCGPANFSHFNNYLYGNCYTFNSGLTNDVIQSSKSGPLYGLELELYIEEEEYISDFQEAAGIRVSVHEQNVMSFPEDEGLSVQPGVLTSIGIRKVDIVRQGKQYGNCTDTSEVFEANLFSDFFGVGYSLTACEKSCLHDTILEDCQCTDVRFRYDNASEPCYSTNDTQVACQEEAELKFINEELNCNCSTSCVQSVFEMTTSSATWPISQAEAGIRADLMEISEDLSFKVLSDTDFVQNNVLKIQVYYEQLNYEAIIETPGYDVFSLISDLGGQIGLWLGVSMITVFEFVELLFDFAKVLVYKINKSRQHRNRATAPSRENLQMTDKEKDKKTAPIERYDSGVFGGYYDGQFQ